jgi:translation initiation factor 3 subunit H
VDHLHVGWYQSNPFGSQISKLETIDSQYMYQSAIEESVVLFYDPIRTARGFLSLKAYRLTNVAMKLCKEGEFTTETLRSNHMSFDKFFEEIPLVIKNSHLINGFSALEKSMQSHMKCVEDVSKHANYLRQQTIKQQHVAKENMTRSARNEPPLSEEEANKILKPLAPLQRLESLLNYCQTLNYCQQSASYSTQNIGKLFMAKALQPNSATKAVPEKN